MMSGNGNRDIFIGLDSGTSVVKAIAFDSAGRQMASASTENHPVISGVAVEQDMNEVWRAAAGVLAKLGDRIPDLARRTACLAVTAQGDGTWLIDRYGAPVGRAWLWLDGRSGPVVEELERAGTGTAVFRRTGTVLSPSLQSAQLLAMKRLEPDRLAVAAHALHCKDWLYFRLTGEIATDPCEGVNTFGDTGARRYDDALIERLGLAGQRRLLPDILDGTVHHGRLGAEAAKAAGLAAGMPVVLAPVDYLATSIGAGVLSPAKVGCSVLGSAGMHQMLMGDPRPALDGPACGYTILFPREGTWVRMVSNMATTLNIDWFVDGIVEIAARSSGGRIDRQRLLALLDEGAGKSEPGSVLFHPYVSEAGERGPFVDPRARAQFHGISTRTTFDDLMRAIFEGIAFAARDCYAAMPAMPTELHLAGGAARSATMRRILAAVMRVPVRRTRQDEAGALGAVAVASVCLGAFADIDAACAAWIDPNLDAPETPDAMLADRYDAVFGSYLAARNDSRGIWSSIHTLRGH